MMGSFSTRNAAIGWASLLIWGVAPAPVQAADNTLKISPAAVEFGDVYARQQLLATIGRLIAKPLEGIHAFERFGIFPERDFALVGLVANLFPAL